MVAWWWLAESGWRDAMSFALASFGRRVNSNLTLTLIVIPLILMQKYWFLGLTFALSVHVGSVGAWPTHSSIYQIIVA